MNSSSRYKSINYTKRRVMKSIETYTHVQLLKIHLSLILIFSQIFKGPSLSNPKNVILLYLNVDSIRKKFDNLQKIIKKNLDVSAVTETKIDASFPSAQFFLEGYHSPY